MRYDLLVTGNVVTPEGIVRGGTVAVSDGRIAEVLPAAAELDAASVLDATELLVETVSRHRSPSVFRHDDPAQTSS